jgi:hypothetical protein
MRAFVVAGPEDMVSDRDLTQGDDNPGAARARQGGQGGRPRREAKEGGQGGRPAREASEGGQRGRPAREASEGGEGGRARDCLEVGAPPPGPLPHAARQVARAALADGVSASPTTTNGVVADTGKAAAAPPAGRWPSRPGPPQRGETRSRARPAPLLLGVLVAGRPRHCRGLAFFGQRVPGGTPHKE